MTTRAIAKKVIASVLFLLVLFISLQLVLLKESNGREALPDTESAKLTLLPSLIANARLQAVSV